MIVADTSALISLATIEVLGLVMDHFDVHTTSIVIEELRNTARYDDDAGAAAQHALEQDKLTVHDMRGDVFTSSRVDRGEGSCCALADRLNAEFLLTDDLHALPELQNLTQAKTVISPIVLKALMERGILEQREALDHLEQLAKNRDWLGAPIYRRAQRLLRE